MDNQSPSLMRDVMDYIEFLLQPSALWLAPRSINKFRVNPIAHSILDIVGSHHKSVGSLSAHFPLDSCQIDSQVARFTRLIRLKTVIGPMAEGRRVRFPKGRSLWLAYLKAALKNM